MEEQRDRLPMLERLIRTGWGDIPQPKIPPEILAVAEWDFPKRNPETHANDAFAEGTRANRKRRLLTRRRALL